MQLTQVCISEKSSLELHDITVSAMRTSCPCGQLPPPDSPLSFSLHPASSALLLGSALSLPEVTFQKREKEKGGWEEPLRSKNHLHRTREKGTNSGSCALTYCTILHALLHPASPPPLFLTCSQGYSRLNLD